MSIRLGSCIRQEALPWHMDMSMHDCAKCLPTEKKISLCEKSDILISKVERENPGLLHAKAGMVLAEEAYGVKDPQILHAIKVHTTGEPDMNTLDKIIYIRS